MKTTRNFAILSILWAAPLAHSAVIATDDFENNNPGTAYNDGIQYGDNGGTGFGAITYLEGSGGGLFDATLGGARALGVFAGNLAGNTQAFGRTVTSTLVGTYTFQARFDVSNTVAFSGFNIKSAFGSLFGSSELLSFGLTPGSGNTSLFVGGSVNTTLALPLADIRGQNLDFKLDFDTNTGAYTLSAKKTTDLAFSSVSGLLKDTNGAAAGVGPLAAVGVGNFNTGSNQNLVADNLNIIPEPSSAVVGLIGSVLLFRRRK